MKTEAQSSLGIRCKGRSRHYAGTGGGLRNTGSEGRWPPGKPALGVLDPPLSPGYSGSFSEPMVLASSSVSPRPLGLTGKERKSRGRIITQTPMFIKQVGVENKRTLNGIFYFSFSLVSAGRLYSSYGVAMILLCIKKDSIISFHHHWTLFIVYVDMPLALENRDSTDWRIHNTCMKLGPLGAWVRSCRFWNSKHLGILSQHPKPSHLPLANPKTRLNTAGPLPSSAPPSPSPLQVRVKHWAICLHKTTAWTFPAMAGEAFLFPVSSIPSPSPINTKGFNYTGNLSSAMLLESCCRKTYSEASRSCGHFPALQQPRDRAVIWDASQEGGDLFFPLSQ